MSIQNKQRTQGSCVAKHKEYKAHKSGLTPPGPLGKHRREETAHIPLMCLHAEGRITQSDTRQCSNPLVINQSHCGEGREIGGEGNNQNQTRADSVLGRKLVSAPELFLTV